MQGVEILRIYLPGSDGLGKRSAVSRAFRQLVENKSAIENPIQQEQLPDWLTFGELFIVVFDHTHDGIDYGEGRKKS